MASQESESTNLKRPAELDAQNNSSSAAPAKRQHPTDWFGHEDYELFSTQVDSCLAEKYLSMLEEFLELMGASRHSVDAKWLVKFACGKFRFSWSDALDSFEISNNKVQEEKLAQLVFMRRYPTFFEYDQIDLPTRIRAIQEPTEQGELLLNPTSMNGSDLDVRDKGYTSQYVGSNDIVTPTFELLCDFASKWDYKSYFSPCTSLVGPTMIGKTRLLMELAPHVCVVYICLRPRNSTGLPPRSQLADTMLTCPHVEKAEHHYVKIITAILNVMFQFFESCQRQKTPTEKMLEWFTYHRSPESTFYSKFQAEFRSPTDNVEASLNEAREALCNIIPYKNASLKVLLAIDEARALLELPGDQSTTPESVTGDDRVSMFRLFHRALKLLPAMSGVFAVMADTTSRVANFSPAGEHDPSSRAIGPEYHNDTLYPPLYKIDTFDRLVNPNPTMDFKELVSPQRLCNYGVPFFGLYLQDAKEKGRAEETVVDDLIDFALQKLLCVTNLQALTKIKTAHAFALLGPTIAVHPNGHSHVNQQLTSSHAAHCTYLSTDRKIQFSIYPSQPIYATAANHYFQTEEDKLVSCIKSLTVALRKGVVSTGDAGEIASRIILLTAMNKTVSDMLSSSKKPDTKTNRSFPIAVPVAEFLKTLTGLPANELPLGTIDPESKKKLLENGVMFWNHFIHCPDTPTTELLMKNFHRALAFQCKPTQKAFDQILTIYLKEASRTTLDNENVTFCGVQVKNRKRDKELNTCQSKMNPRRAGIQINPENPYLALHFSLQPGAIANDQHEQKERYRLPSHGTADRKQASLLFRGLDSFHFLSPPMKSSLADLIDLRLPLLKLHEEDPLALNYVRHLMAHTAS